MSIFLIFVQEDDRGRRDKTVGFVLLAWAIIDPKVETREEFGPSSLSSREYSKSHEEFEGFVVSLDNDWVRCTFELNVSIPQTNETIARSSPS